MTEPLRVYCSTSATAGDCLGGKLSGMRFQGLQPWVSFDSINCLRILGIKQYSNITTYTITRTGNDFTLTIGAVTGTAVTLTQGVPAILSATTGGYTYAVEVVIDRASTATTGTIILTPNVEWNNAIGMADIAPAASGTNTQYRCLFLYATENVWIKAVNTSKSEGTVSYYYWLDNTNSKTAATTTGTTDFTGSSWTAATGGAIDIAVAAGAFAKLYIKRVHTSDNVDYCPMISLQVTYATVSSGGTQQSIYLLGRYAQATTDAAVKTYAVYDAATTASVGGALLDSFNDADLPRTITVSLPYHKKLRIAKIAQAATGKYSKIVSLSDYLTNEANISAGGDDLLVPDAPTGVTASEIGGGAFSVTATWTPGDMFTTVKTWTVSASGDKGYSESQTVRGGHSEDGEFRLVCNMPAADWNEAITASVTVTSTLGEDDKTSAAATDTLTITEISQPVALTAIATAAIAADSVESGVAEYSETFSTATVRGGFNQASLLNSTTEILYLFDAFRTSYSLSDAGVSGAAAALVEVSGGVVYISVDGTRKASFDTATSACVASGFKDTITAACPFADAVYGDTTATWFNFYDAYSCIWRPWLCVTAAGILEWERGLVQS